MRQKCLFFLMLLLLGALSACSPGHLGGNEIAFVRNGVLWTIDPDGANTFAVAAQDTPVVGYSWSPSHQILAFRTLDPDFAKTAVGKQAGDPVLGFREDVPSTINTVGLDGGTSIPTYYSTATLQDSNPIWNATSTRLLFRQEAISAPAQVNWFISQSDQPAGIALKQLPTSSSIPSLSSDGQSVLGNSAQGIYTTTIAGTNQRYLLSGQLPGHPLPASLERILWQPAHAHPAIVYAVALPTQQKGPLQVQLIMYTADQQERVVATCTCTQFAWSPDGNMLLYNTATSSIVYTLATHSTFTISSEAGSVPYWSPDSRFLLFDGPHRLLLVHIADHQQQLLLQDTEATRAQGPESLPGTDALLQPAPNSPWAPDGRHFLLLSRGRLLWQGHTLSSGNGLYTVTVDDNGRLQGAPSLVDGGNDTQAGWSYEDANTSFLYQANLQEHP